VSENDFTTLTRESMSAVNLLRALVVIAGALVAAALARLLLR
jgi:hypothetical protein